MVCQVLTTYKVWSKSEGVGEMTSWVDMEFPIIKSGAMMGIEIFQNRGFGVNLWILGIQWGVNLLIY